MSVNIYKTTRCCIQKTSLTYVAAFTKGQSLDPDESSLNCAGCYREVYRSCNTCDFVLWRCPVRISVATPIIPTQVFRRFPKMPKWCLYFKPGPLSLPYLFPFKLQINRSILAWYVPRFPATRADRRCICSGLRYGSSEVNVAATWGQLTDARI
jgi:hypothetical protein